jgi:hypothetical protein
LFKTVPPEHGKAGQSHSEPMFFTTQFNISWDQRSVLILRIFLYDESEISVSGPDLNETIDQFTISNELTFFKNDNTNKQCI